MKTDNLEYLKKGNFCEIDSNFVVMGGMPLSLWQKCRKNM